MSHMVIYRSSDGKPGYQQVEELEEAIRFVERLRNEQGVTDAKLFDLVEVPISFKAYYQVEVGSRGTVEVSSSPADPSPAAAPAPAPASAPAAASASASGPEPVKAVASEPMLAEPAVPAAVKPGAPVGAAAAASKPEEKGDPASNGGRFGLFGKS